MTGIALFPGAFKPPTKGHFEAVKELATNTFTAASFQKDEKGKLVPGTLDKGTTENKISEVVVIISNKPRNGITSEISFKIWNLYKKYLPENVTIVESQDADPVRTALSLVKNNPDTNYFGVVFLRTEEDFPDLSRISTFEKYDNSKGLALKSTLTDVRATDLRKSVIEDNIELFKKFIPDELTEEEIQNIYQMVRETVKAESKLFEELGFFVDNLFPENKTFLEEGSSGTPIKMMSAISSADRAKLIRAYHTIVNVLGANFYDIKFNGDHIRVQLKSENEKIGFDYTPYMASILEFMINEGIKINPLPEVRLRRDNVEAADFFGKTAHYDPNSREITLYVQDRHPKDVMRSFVHEMIHHIQNLEGRINDIRTSNVNEDDALVELEKEAYMRGNMIFRSWEDSLKK